MMKRIATAVLLLTCPACRSGESKECERLFEEAQQVVLKVDGASIDSVTRSLASVDRAMDGCEKAGRTGERDELDKARRELRAHLEVLEQRRSRPARRKLNEAELAEYVKKGDPTCPRGQGYKHAASGNEIKCRGPQLVELGYAAAREYYEKRGYKVTDEPPATLKAEYGAELYTFSYATPKDDNAATCVKLYPAPGMPWQEAAARATGTPPERLKPGDTVSSKRGPLALHVEDSDKKVVVSLGDCP
jgi:hypothetical protein